MGFSVHEDEIHDELVIIEAFPVCFFRTKRDELLRDRGEFIVVRVYPFVVQHELVCDTMPELYRFFHVFAFTHGRQVWSVGLTADVMFITFTSMSINSVCRSGVTSIVWLTSCSRQVAFPCNSEYLSGGNLDPLLTEIMAGCRMLSSRNYYLLLLIIDSRTSALYWPK